jgi:hypothetical protein
VKLHHTTLFVITTVFSSCLVLAAGREQVMTFSNDKLSMKVTPVELNSAAICQALKSYPKRHGETLAFETETKPGALTVGMSGGGIPGGGKGTGEVKSSSKGTGEVSALCRPFVGRSRANLDLCGDGANDPYATQVSRMSQPLLASQSRFTFPSRNEMYKRGKINLLTDPRFESLSVENAIRIGEIRSSATEFCCGGDETCQEAMGRVPISLCQPGEKLSGESPDPCVFGGSYSMSGESYASIFEFINKGYDSPQNIEIREIARRNLRYYGAPKNAQWPFWKFSKGSAGSVQGSSVGRASDVAASQSNLGAVKGTASLLQPVDPFSFVGKIILTSYVPENEGFATLVPTLQHELGHACSMVHMQMAAASGIENIRDDGNNKKAMRAVQWLNLVKDRCNADAVLPDAYFDFWEALGEPKAVSQCLLRLAELNQKQLIDRKCEKLCPGHYLEESVGIAFSLLVGDLRGETDSVFPNTCDHVRDGQHPMVSDVVECLAQNSPRFRTRLSAVYKCDSV